MIEFFGPGTPGTQAALAVALDVSVKATALILLVFAAHWALGRRQALIRSALWNALLVGLLLLPAASLAFPRLSVPMPIAWRVVTPGPSAIDASPPATDARHSSPGELPVVEAVEARSAPIPLPEASRLRPPAVVDVTPPRPGPRPIAAAPRLDASWIALVVYAAVCSVLALRLGLSLAAVERLRRRCEPVEEDSWISALGRWRSRLGVGRAVLLLGSDRVTVPAVVGWLRPAIVVPRSLARSAGPGVVDAVLLHELGHVRRGDYGWNLVLRLVRILYWPHPLIWPLGRVVGAVREQACDDLCVHALGGASAYRDSLVEVAASLIRRPDTSLGLAMARRTTLGRRLAWIDRSRGASRCLLRWPARLALAATALAVAGVVGSVELARATARPADEPKSAGAAAPAAADGPSAVEITVRAQDTGQPLAGARVRAYLNYEFEHLTTDREGKARVDFNGRAFRDALSLDIWADGYVQQRHDFSQDDARSPKIPAEVSFELRPGEETLGGKVTDEEGLPIPGVKVEVWGYLGKKKEKHELAYMVDATTDGEGNWRCRCFRKMTFAYLYLSHPDYVSDGEFHPRPHGRPRPSAPPTPQDGPMETLRDFSDVQVMTRGVSVAGTVVDEQGRPVDGAEVGMIESDYRETFHSVMPTTTADAEGRFRFTHVRPGRVVIQAKARGHAPGLKAVEAKEGVDGAEVRLGLPKTLAGRVVDSEGRPIPGAVVSIDSWRGYRALGVFLKTDSDGRYRWEKAPDDSVLINANRPGYEGISRHRAAPAEGDVVLTLNRSLVISGRVHDVESDEPIDRMQVEVGIPDPMTGAVSWMVQPRAFASQGQMHATLNAERSPEYRLRIRAKGYEPFESRAFRSDERQVIYDVKLTKSDKPQDEIVSGVVHRPDGMPLEGAEVVVTYPLTGGPVRLPTVHIEDGRLTLGQDQESVKTDAEGRFSLTREPDPAGRYFAVVVVHPDFYAEADRAAFEADPTITARPWGRVEGVAFVGGKPSAGGEVRYFADRLGNPDVAHVSDSGKATADAEGRFVLERVVPGDVRVARDLGEGRDLRARSNGTLVAVRADEITRIQVGGVGRPVVARIVPPEGFDPEADYVAHSEFDLQSDRPNIPYPRGFFSRRDGSTIGWGKRWWASREGHEYRRSWFWLGSSKLQPDGTIRAEDVPPGEYRLTLRYSADPVYGPGIQPERVAFATKQFIIPEIPGGRSDEPFDLGVLRPKPRQTLKVGQPAPPFEVETLDGRHLRLEDFRGKYVLLDFLATWCGPCVAEIPQFQEIHERFGNDERFAMLSLSVDAEKDAPRKFAEEKELAWAQGFLGEWTEGGVQDAYHVEAIPSVFLIAPDGTLKAQGLRGDLIGQAVERALESP
jgi:beta-lactamase regulating signal transducer with metallopeptidase domain/protocatechuate 3,4-dioxygenase beta subunit/peroxiredoxin